MPAKTAATPAPKRLIRIKQMQEWLGVSRNTADKIIADKRNGIRRILIGGPIRIPYEDIEKYISKNSF